MIDEATAAILDSEIRRAVLIRNLAVADADAAHREAIAIIDRRYATTVADAALRVAKVRPGDK